MGNGEWGMGNGEEVTNAQCPMPQATGQLSLYRHLEMEFPVAFNEYCCGQLRELHKTLEA
ncbi:hypothetical protein [Nostoc sp.]|uniref:hypothetical protein n=1 Tax=Nostoc sp. TaxID=1180 RepID=UPI002FF4798C